MGSYTCPDRTGSAQAAKLRYVNDATPGIARRPVGSAFGYFLPDGKRIRNRETLARIKALAIPPAWQEVWICTRRDGHIQATGRDARGRKQYRYHRRWREVRDETKYHRMAAFGRVLPRIRRRVRQDLALPGLPRAKVLATVVRLLEMTRMRVGNEEYARENDSFGLTTLRTRQVRLKGATLQFRFRGKSGVWHAFAVSDRRLASIVRRMRDLPGYDLFHICRRAWQVACCGLHRRQRLLETIAGEEFTSKDFRTWAGTVLAAEALYQFGKNGVSQAIERVARQLGNTKVCRKCYIHPALVQAHLDGGLARAMTGRSAEACVKRLLDRRSKPSLVPLLTKSPTAQTPWHAACEYGDTAIRLTENAMTVKSVASATLLALASVAIAQPQSGLTPPSVTPSDTPAVAPSQSPSVTPSISPSQAPSAVPNPASGATATSAPRAVGGMSQCQNLIGGDRDKCLQDERAATMGGGAGAGTTAPPAGPIR